ncbi:MAG: hypothetical protein WCP34_00300 [Pseudomonadota bacterium]
MVRWRRISRIKWLGTMASFSIALTPLLSGCAVNPKVDAAIADTGDYCHVQRVALGELRKNMVAETAKGALFGAAAGAVAGVAIAATTHGNIGAGAAIGAASGAVMGAFASYYGSLQSKSGQDPNLFYSTFVSDVNQEHERIQKANRRLDDLLICRKQQAKSIRTAHRHKDIDRATAQHQMDDIRSRLQDDLAIASEIRKDVVDRAKNIQFAGMKVAPRQVAYVDLDQTDDYDSGKRKSKGRTKSQHQAPPPDLQKRLAEQPAPPKAEGKEARSKLAASAQSVNQTCDEALHTTKSCNEIGKMAQGNGLELSGAG